MSMNVDKQPNGSKSVALPAQTPAVRFTTMVMKEFSANAAGGKFELTPYQERLAQHMFIAVDVALRNAEVKRSEDTRKKDNLPITWANVNMTKLAIDAVHRTELGLDALIPNHIHPIAYFNKRLNQYDLDLQIGYVGKDYYRRKVAVEQPIDIVYELVYANDKFFPHKKSYKNPVESYEFEIPKPFDRGEIVGGFGYIMYKNPEMNKLIIVTGADFKRSEKLKRGGTFWADHPEVMKFKTIVNRVTSKLGIDPEKTSGALAAVENYEAEVEAEVEREQGASETIDMDLGPGGAGNGATKDEEFLPEDRVQVSTPDQDVEVLADKFETQDHVAVGKPPF
jgi:recombination protein RecT